MVPGKLPGNDFAFKNALFVHSSEYAKYSKTQRKCFVTATKANRNFVFELLPCDEIPVGQFGASALQKDMMKISKIDDTPIQITKAVGLIQNPIANIELQLELIKADPSVLTGSHVQLQTDDVGEALLTVYKDKIINFEE